MDTKYYTPEISEFYVGFEYEEKSSGLWTKQIYNDKSPILTGQWFDGYTYMYNTIEQYIQQEIIRVKYLDREDIESLGFKHIGAQFYEDENEEWRIRKWKGTQVDIWYCKSCLYFRGDIKNKSELIKVLKMLNVK
jgi:hypothetical protein